MDDDVNVGTLCNILYILERCVGVHTETKPHMRRHQQNAVSTGLLGLLSHLNGFCGIFAVNTGDDGHLVAALLCTDLNNTLTLCTCQAGNLTGMAVTNETLDSLSIEALDPTQVSTELWFIDCIIVIHRNRYCREDSFEIFNLSHDFDLLFAWNNVELPDSVGRASRALMSSCSAIVCFAMSMLYHDSGSIVNRIKRLCKSLHAFCNLLHNRVK